MNPPPVSTPSRREFYALLDDLAAHGASILLSCHALTEVEARTDRIVILSRGRLVAEGNSANVFGNMAECVAQLCVAFAKVHLGEGMRLLFRSTLAMTGQQ